METTENGTLEGYTHHEIKEEGADLVSISLRFYKRVIKMVEGKEVVYRVTPRATEHQGRYRFYARLHIKD